MSNSQEILAGIESHEIESHFADIYNYLSKRVVVVVLWVIWLASESTNVSEKLNALNYFETIIKCSSVANRLVNSAFMNLLLQILTTIQVANLRIRVCSIVGQLIRHATVIDNDLAELDISGAFAKIAKEKNDRLKRKVIATFGEYLFYSATQMDEEQNNVPTPLTTCLFLISS